MVTVFDNVLALGLAVLLAQAPIQKPQAPPEAAAPEAVQSSGEVPDLPVDLDKIQRALSRPPAISTRSDRPVFRVEIIAKKPTLNEILGPDWHKGPTYGAMTHSEFLNMVTPQEFRGMGVFTSGEALVVAATAIGLQWALSKAIDKLKDAKTEREKEAARREVLDAMNELAEARKRAGKR